MRRLFSAWKLDDRPHTIVRALHPDERSALVARAEELRAGLHRYLPNERDEVEASIAAMFGGFRSMRQEGESAEGLVMVAAGVLREFPAWAIVQGCMKIAQNDAGLDPRWPPNDAQIHDVVLNVVKEYRKTLERIEALLVAPVEDRQALPAPVISPPNDVLPLGQQPFAPLVEVRPNDGKHAQRVAAQLAAKRAQQQIAAE